MTKAVSNYAYRSHEKAAKETAAALAAARRDGLAKIAARRTRITREDAVAAYCDARFWARTYAERLAAVHPEKAPDWSPARRRRAGLE